MGNAVLQNVWLSFWASYLGSEVPRGGGFCCVVCTGLPSVAVLETRPCSFAFAPFKPAKACLAMEWFVGLTIVTSLYLNLLSLAKIFVKYSV